MSSVPSWQKVLAMLLHLEAGSDSVESEGVRFWPREHIRKKKNRLAGLAWLAAWTERASDLRRGHAAIFDALERRSHIMDIQIDLDSDDEGGAQSSSPSAAAAGPSAAAAPAPALAPPPAPAPAAAARKKMRERAGARLGGARPPEV